MKKEIDYIVSRTVKGTQTLIVKASSAAEAKRKVDSWDESVRGCELSIDLYGKANSAFRGENR